MFEELGNKIANLGSSAKQGAVNFGESVKQGANAIGEKYNLNNKLDNCKKELKQVYTDLGEKFYLMNSENVPTDYAYYFEKISGIQKEIAQTEQALRDLSGVRKCPQCGADVPKGNAFCTNCGFKMAEEKKEEPAQGGKVVCSGCGKEVPEGFAFCAFCGTKIEAPKPVQPQEILVCPQCGNKVSPGAAFCNMCGRPLK